MASTISTRIWRVHKEAGIPFPTLTEDDVMQYLIVEAVMVKVKREEAEAAKAAEKEAKKRQWEEEAAERLNRLR